MSSHDNDQVTYFGETDARNRLMRFGIKREDRTRHMYVIGKTGMGKSTLLENLAIQDIQNGEGVAFIDPHGKTAELLLEYVPENRMKDVVYFAPFDMEHPVSFNVMEDVGADRRHLVANGLMSAFKKIWVDAWSARMEYILNNIMLALLEFPGSTLLGINRMLADKEFRNKVVSNITDPSVRSFWVDEYAKYTDKFAAEAAPAIQNKVGQFVANPLVRNIIGQAKSSFDIRKMMDEKKILIINLSKGRVGEGNANLLGSMLVTKIYLAAMSRADLSEGQMDKVAPFYLYVDEFQNFANESFADILSEARKYKLNLTIAHQYIEQMPEEVRSAVFGNVGTMVTFRVGATDAEVLEKEFAPVFTQEDLVNLGMYQIYLKLMIDKVSSRPFSARTMGPIAKPEVNLKDKIIETSRSQFSRSREAVESEIRDWHLQRFTDGPGGGSGGGAGGKSGGDRSTGDRPATNFDSDRPKYDYKGNLVKPKENREPYREPASSSSGRPRFDDRPKSQVQTQAPVRVETKIIPKVESKIEKTVFPPPVASRPVTAATENPAPATVRSAPAPNTVLSRPMTAPTTPSISAVPISRTATRPVTEKPPLPNVSLADAIKLAKLEHEQKEKATEVDNKKKADTENDLRKAISLSYLHSEPEKNQNHPQHGQHSKHLDNKSARPEQFSALKDVIVNYKSKGGNQGGNQGGNSQPISQPKQSREVPEDVLKKVFDVGESGFK